MTTENQKTLKPLVNILRFYGWVKVLRLPGKNMLVADPEFITELRSQVGDLTCEFSVPSQAIDDIKASEAKRIIVLSKSYEVALVKRLRTAFPNRQVFSTLYDLCPRSFVGPFHEKQSSINSSSEGSSVRNVAAMLLTSASSDIEHLSNLFDQNTLGTVHRPFGRAAQALMDYVSHFEPIRYFATYAKSAIEPGSLNIVSIELEILEDIVRKTRLSLLRLKDIVEKNELKTVYFQRRDKLTQAAINAFLVNHPASSIWDLPPARQANFVKSRTLGFVHAVNRMHETIGNESRFEKFLSQLPDVHITILEELIETPINIISGLASFLSLSTPSRLEVPDYSEIYGKIDGLMEQVAEFKREYIDRLGLHTSDAGSLITETEKLLSSRK